MKYKEIGIKILLCILPPVLFEIWFRFLVLDTNASLLPAICYGAIIGSIIYFLTGWFTQKVGKIIFCIHRLCLEYLYMKQVSLFHRIFGKMVVVELN